MRPATQAQARCSPRDAATVTIASCVTPQLDFKIAAKAKEYGMSRSQLIRSVLEMVDDEGLWEKLLGPPA